MFDSLQLSHKSRGIFGRKSRGFMQTVEVNGVAHESSGHRFSTSICNFWKNVRSLAPIAWFLGIFFKSSRFKKEVNWWMVGRMNPWGTTSLHLSAKLDNLFDPLHLSHKYTGCTWRKFLRFMPSAAPHGPFLRLEALIPTNLHTPIWALFRHPLQHPLDAHVGSTQLPKKERALEVSITNIF